jgi:hypothetical protein
VNSTQDFDLRELISSARHRLRSGDAAVLDLLLRSSGSDESAMIGRLKREAGVDVVCMNDASPQ